MSCAVNDWNRFVDDCVRLEQICRRLRIINCECIASMPVLMIDGRGGMVVISNSQPVVSLMDRSGRGGYDSVSYSILGADHQPIGDVTDGDMDGRLDLKIMKDNKAFVNIDDQWLRLQKRGDKQGVLLEEQWHAVRKQGWQWVLSTE